MEVPTAVYVIWWIMLIVTVVVVLPLVVALLHRAFSAARQIEHYAARALEAGNGVAGNTANITALNQTIEGASGIVATARDIEEHTGTIEGVLAQRAGRAGS
jgi:sensor histidine kinase regulating citrate/malate metabolism